MIIVLIVKILLFIVKLVVFTFIKYKDTALIPWNEWLVNFGNLLSILIVGLPIYSVVGLGLGATLIKSKMKS